MWGCFRWPHSYKQFNGIMNHFANNGKEYIRKDLNPNERQEIIKQILFLKTKTIRSTWVVKQIQKLQQKL